MASDAREQIRDSLECFPDAAEIAFGHAAWTLLEYGFKDSRRNYLILSQFDSLTDDQGLIKVGNFDLLPDNPASVGVSIAGCGIQKGLLDGANEELDYQNREYPAINEPRHST